MASAEVDNGSFKERHCCQPQGPKDKGTISSTIYTDAQRLGFLGFHKSLGKLPITRKQIIRIRTFFSRKPLSAFRTCWNLSNSTVKTLVSTATRIWGESGLCLLRCVWHFHLALVPVRKQRQAEPSTLRQGGTAWPTICLMSELSHPVARPYVQIQLAPLTERAQRLYH